MPPSPDAPRFDLYGMTSPNVRKVSLMLEELEAPYRLRQVKVFRGEQFTPEFRALNPISKVPVLVDRQGGEPGYPVFESGAILVYLAEAFGRFLPASGPSRYETLKWLFVQVANVGPMLGQFNHFRMMGEETAPAAFARYRTVSAKIYGLLDERLADRPYLAGDDYSIADIATYPWAAYVKIHEMDWADFPHLARWREAIGERPAAKRESEVNRSLIYAEEDGMTTASQADIDRFWWRG